MRRQVLAVFALLAGVLLLPLSSDAARAEKRVALVIGNGAYQTVAQLPNPPKDAAAIAEMFKKSGFEWVKLRSDLGNLEFKRALREFMDAATDADVAVVYYAGHGIQVRDMNYMIPVDAKLATEIDAEDEAVSLDRIVAALEPAKRLRLVILDACRDNPFARTMKRRVAMRAINGGLAKMEPTLGDTLIAYAAKAGSTAEDGEGANSPFATALIKHLAVPGLDIRLAFGRIRDDVLKSTGNRQEPFVYGSLGGESIALVPAPAQPKAQPLADVKGDYELVERIGTKKGWEAFLSSHKDGLYAELARAQLAKITQAEKSGGAATSETRGTQNITLAAVEPTVPPKPSGPSTEERRAWDRVRDSNDRGKLREFISKYPASPLSETAKNRLDTLEQAAQERDEKARSDREAARQRDEEARQAKEAARQAKANEQEAARQREEAARLAKANEQEAARQAKTSEVDRKQQDETCRRDDEKLARLSGSVSQAWAREDLKRLQRETPCDRVRAQATTLLVQTPETSQQAVAPQAPSAPEQNTPELVRAAQGELRRIGCFEGRDDGKLSSSTKEAIQKYLSQKGRSTNDVKVTDTFVTDLKDESGRVCPLSCSRGEHAEGDRCIANAKPQEPEKKATSRQRDRDEERASRREAKPKREPREEPKREATRAKPERAKPERAASRPQPAARSQASAAPARHYGGGGGGMVGVGF